MSGVDIGLGGIGGVVDGEGVIAYILASVLDGDGVDGVLELESENRRGGKEMV